MNQLRAAASAASVYAESGRRGQAAARRSRDDLENKLLDG